MVKDTLYDIVDDVYEVFNDLSADTCEYIYEQIQEEVDYYHDHIIFEPNDIEGYIWALIDDLLGDIEKVHKFDDFTKETRRKRAEEAALKHFKNKEEKVC